MTEQRIVLPPSPRSAADARHFVAQALEGSRAAACTETAALLTSELVANAVLHARSPVEMRVSITGVTVRVDVHDREDRLPDFGGRGETFSGRGLQIVQSLARSCGAAPAASGGKTVWFELSAQE